jgi:hypothetical protein
MESPVCNCTSPVCGHPKGRPCGKPVAHPFPPLPHELETRTYPQEDAPGLCEECFQRLFGKH